MLKLNSSRETSTKSTCGFCILQLWDFPIWQNRLNPPFFHSPTTAFLRKNPPLPSRFWLLFPSCSPFPRRFSKEIPPKKTFERVHFALLTLHPDFRPDSFIPSAIEFVPPDLRSLPLKLESVSLGLLSIPLNRFTMIIFRPNLS